MAQPNSNFSDQNYPGSSRERRAPSPITHLPIKGLSDDIDPTREIRTLIDQLQQSAKDARSQVRTAEAERDDMAAQADHFRQQNEELRARFIEITSIIRERDAALEEVDRMSRMLTDTQLRLTNASREITEAQRQRDEALQQRKELLVQRNEGLAQQAALSQQRDELVRQLEVAVVTDQESARRLLEIQKQLNSIREARDAAQARSGEQSVKIAALEEELVTLRDEAEFARHNAVAPIDEARFESVAEERDQARSEAELLRTELGTLRAELDVARARTEQLSEELRVQRESAAAVTSGQADAQKALDEMSRRLQEAQAQYANLTQERSTASGAREEALASLAAAQQKIERLIRDRDSIRQQGTESMRAQEAQLEALRAQLAIFESTNPEAAQHTGEIRDLARRLAHLDEERRELAHRLEKQREETVDLAGQLRSAQDQIRQMSASLAEARLLGRSAAKAAASSSVPSAPPALPSPIFDSGEAINAMREAFQNFTLNTADPSPLLEVARQGATVAKLAADSRIIAVERLSHAFSELAAEVAQFPDRTSPEIIRTIQQTIEFLATLSTMKDLSAAKDPASARAYAVDDEGECCEVVRRVMATATVQTTCASDPAQALADLASQQFDVIFLDVNMPGLNGFELCAQIRSLSVNASTPVIFLTGYNTAENRLHSTMSGGNEFVGKPFLYPEVTVKALTLMLKAQFHIA